MLKQLPRIPIAQVLTVGLLPSALKVRWYRLRGYRIGRGVRLGFGAVVCGRDVAIGDGTQVGFFTIVRGRTVTLGRRVQLGAMTFLDVPRIRIGDDTRINEQVFVGGLQRPDSVFEVGRNCQIMQMTFINPAVSVTIGDDSGIGGHCLVFGHTSWLSRFEGYPVDFQPVTIGRSVSIAWGVFLLPGTVIEDGAVVGARSVVSRRIPPRCLAVGYPARVVAREPDFPRVVPDAEKETIFDGIVAEAVEQLETAGARCTREGDRWHVVTRRRRWTGGMRRDTFSAARDPWPETLMSAGPRVDVLVSLRAVPEWLRRRLDGCGTVWIDIERKERAEAESALADAILQTFRRHGVRLFRTPPLPRAPGPAEVRTPGRQPSYQ
jgi:acetyltransferase-like isoleucine patch superfamily enzyme